MPKAWTQTALEGIHSRAEFAQALFCCERMRDLRCLFDISFRSARHPRASIESSEYAYLDTVIRLEA